MSLNDFDEFVIKLRVSLRQRPGFGENDSEFWTHCPVCELDRSITAHGHLYISHSKLGNPIECKKCGLRSPVLSLQIVQDLNISDIDILSYVSSKNKVKLTHTVSINERDVKLDYKIQPCLARDRYKLTYLESRTRFKISEDDILTYRIITNLSRFIEKNNVPDEELDIKVKNMIPTLNRDYVGFLSLYGNKICFRKVCDDIPGDKYINISISKIVKKSYLYMPAIGINPIADKCEIKLSESVIDIINIHRWYGGGEVGNVAYGATLSRGSFKRILKDILSITGFYGAKVTMFLDNDEGVTNIRDLNISPVISIIDTFKGFVFEIVINLLGKDFGNFNKPIKIAKLKLK